MDTIHTRIQNVKFGFEMDTGKEPNIIYMGKDEIRELMDWAVKNCYVNEVDKNRIEGSRRPEVAGLLVYEVNAKSHLACSL